MLQDHPSTDYTTCEKWENEGSPISGATSSTYVLQNSDLGALITVAVTAANNLGTSALALSALAGPVIGTTAYYVSSSAGLDTNPGTLAAPWKTIAKVNAKSFAPGTSVLFKRGDIWDRRAGPSVCRHAFSDGGWYGREPDCLWCLGHGRQSNHRRVRERFAH